MTKRDVKTVRVENTDQHRVAQAGRADAHDELLVHIQTVAAAHGELIGHVTAIHADVRETSHKVGGLDAKLEAHINDLKLHGDAAWRALESS